MFLNAPAFKKKLWDDGVGDTMIEGLGFRAKAGLGYRFKGRLEFVHFDICLFETIHVSVHTCISVEDVVKQILH